MLFWHESHPAEGHVTRKYWQMQPRKFISHLRRYKKATKSRKSKRRWTFYMPAFTCHINNVTSFKTNYNNVSTLKVLVVLNSVHCSTDCFVTVNVQVGSNVRFAPLTNEKREEIKTALWTGKNPSVIVVNSTLVGDNLRKK